VSGHEISRLQHGLQLIMARYTRIINCRPCCNLHIVTINNTYKLQPRGLCVIWRPSPPPQKGGGAPLPIFGGPCLLWPNAWMDQDATWHEGRPQPRRLCVRWGPSPHPSQKGGGGRGQSPPNFRPMAIVAELLDGSRWHLAWR